jgi:hypothetical protein
VKLDKLVRQLRRDITASPKKAAALGLMVLVALYFWAPMVWGWMAPGKGGASSTASAGDVILEDDPVDPAAQARKQRQVFHWERVRRKVLADPRMTPARYDLAWNDPFRGLAATTTNPQSVAGSQAEAAMSLGGDPAQLGLSLTSVAIGRVRRSATISGESYREGEMVPAGGPQGSAGRGIEFRLVHVGFHEVKLERGGRTYTLELSRPRLAAGDELDGQERDGSR